MNTRNPTPAVTDDPQNDRRRWTDPMLVLGIIAGGLLTAAGVYLQSRDALQPTLSTLIICSGLGIIFGAFGSTATVKWKGVVVTGVAAVTMALLGFLNYLMRDQVVNLTIGGQVKGVRSMELIIPQRRSYSGANFEDKYFEFVIFGRDLVSDMQLAVQFPSSDGREDAEVPFECVPRQSLSDFIGGRPVTWRYDATNRTLRNVKGAKDGILGTDACDTNAQSAPQPAFASRGVSFIPSAFAAAAKPVASLVADLDSNSTAVRYAARRQLADAGLGGIAPMMAQWTRKPTYRTQLGVSVALFDYLRKHPDQRPEVSQRLTDADLRLLVDAAVSSDQTLRKSASQFLDLLADRRMLPHASTAFVNADEAGRNNLVLLTRSTIQEMSPDEKAALYCTLTNWRISAADETSRALIDGTLTGLPRPAPAATTPARITIEKLVVKKTCDGRGQSGKAELRWNIAVGPAPSFSADRVVIPYGGEKVLNYLRDVSLSSCEPVPISVQMNDLDDKMQSVGRDDTRAVGVSTASLRAPQPFEIRMWPQKTDCDVRVVYSVRPSTPVPK